ncbi:DUF4190 domain-containing protein [Actinokineospora bangkokensis]|uniref:DUF4190 domain-containing protein n=1 Tax=Actinokineospora bangkokensis TaxID=1193682 RepID=A0A1Q9LEN2_9PSEU|nr:hypothetical protein [Actinokineospora bangkokensis]OLR90482.1 hypothetical protein BJP25_28000 [Actinokineospora bangkokensis]
MTYPQSDSQPTDPAAQGYQAAPSAPSYDTNSGQFPQAPYQGVAPQQQYQNGIGTGGFVCGLLGLILFWFSFVGIILAIIGIALSGVGISKANKGQANNKGLAIAGLVCGVVGLALFVIVVLIVAAALSSGSISY